MKTCRVCKQEKPFEDFTVNRDRSDGYSNLCRICDREKGQRWYAENKHRRSVTQKAYREANRDKFAGYTGAYRERHPDRVAASVEKCKPQRRDYEQRWYADNLESKRAKNRQWSKSNPEAHRALVARHRKRIRTALPKWADQAAIDAIYAAARRLTAETGAPYEVDHIIPLKGKMVSGLHVETNLRIIPMRENRRKHARLIEALA